MPTVKDLLSTKGKQEVFSITATETVYNALAMMAEKNIGALMVTDGERIAGICTERDYARKIILKGHDSRKTQVKDIMTEKLVTVHPDTPLEKCMALMTEYHVRHLPVVDEGHLVGIISIGDVLRSVIADKENLISDLQEYIEGLSILR
ncbi:MAG: CBS domain-containing protein [Anaerolineales bacterium]